MKRMGCLQKVAYIKQPLNNAVKRKGRVIHTCGCINVFNFFFFLERFFVGLPQSVNDMPDEIL